MPARSAARSVGNKCDRGQLTSAMHLLGPRSCASIARSSSSVDSGDSGSCQAAEKSTRNRVIECACAWGTYIDRASTRSANVTGPAKVTSKRGGSSRRRMRLAIVGSWTGAGPGNLSGADEGPMNARGRKVRRRSGGTDDGSMHVTRRRHQWSYWSARRRATAWVPTNAPRGSQRPSTISSNASSVRFELHVEPGHCDLVRSRCAGVRA